MDLAKTSKWRDLSGWVGAAWCLLALLALVDGLIGQWREPASVIKLLPGMTAEINGPLQEEVPGVQELTYFSDSDLLTVTFAAVHKGYFLGGNLWRGQVTVAAQIKPGEYHLTVVPRRSSTAQAAPAFRLLVFPDPESLQHSSKSLIRRHTGFSPWGLAAVCLPGILLCFGTVFFLSLKLEQLLAHYGRAEIYRVIKREGAFEIHFGLGTKHGIHPGLELRVYSRQGKAVGLARVEESASADSIASVSAGRDIRPGFVISKE